MTLSLRKIPCRTRTARLHLRRKQRKRVHSNRRATTPLSKSGFFFQAEDGIRYWSVTGVQTCALPIYLDETGVLRAAEAIASGIPGARKVVIPGRSEERRVGKECRSRWSWYQ